jgi:hypothetical protein
VCIQKVVVSNKDKDATYVMIRAERGAGSTVLGMIETTTATKHYEWDGPVFLRGVRRLELDFYTVDANDDLTAYIYGYYLE